MQGTAVHVQCTVRFTQFSDQTPDELVFVLFQLAAGSWRVFIGQTGR